MSEVSSVLPILRAEMSKMKLPSKSDYVYKDECVYSFDSPFTDTGLYVNTITLGGVGLDYLLIDHYKTGCKVYLWEKFSQIPVVDNTSTETPASAPTKLGVGIEGGFASDAQKYETIKEYTMVVFSPPNRTEIKLPNTELPEYLNNILNAIMSHEGMATTFAVNAFELDNPKIVSKYAENLPQFNPNNKRISQNPKDWKDEGSDATDNLWLNLSTGYIGGGRKNWDGSGGSGTALQHYIETGKKFPLVVKLGTITSQGADVWSYANDEDMLVIDPYLKEHLAFWGINIMMLEKTEKSLAEMEIDLNHTYDWSKIMSGNEQLQNISGPELIGLENIGSSCYMNSLMQCLFHIPQIKLRYLNNQSLIIQSCPIGNPVNDLGCQLSKLAYGILSEKYCPPQLNNSSQSSEDNSAMVTSSEEHVDNIAEIKVVNKDDLPLLRKYRIAPYMLKSILNKNSDAFRSSRQQDVCEYYTYVLTQLEKYEHMNLIRYDENNVNKLTNSLFEFHLQIKFKLFSNPNFIKLTKISNQTLYNLLELPIPLHKAIPIENPLESPENKRIKLENINKNDTENLSVNYLDCFHEYFQSEIVSIENPLTKSKENFMKEMKFYNFPKFLMIKLNRYYLNDNWISQKISCEIQMPIHLDLTQFAKVSLTSEEVVLTEDNNQSTSQAAVAQPVNAPTANPEIVMQLMEMGFSENASQRACLATQATNAEMAMNWLIGHLEDADINDPLPPPVTTAASNAPAAADNTPNVDMEQVAMLVSMMGFSEKQCKAALIATSNNIERAADWLFSHMDTLDQDVENILNPNNPAAGASNTSNAGSVNVDDSHEGKYTLFAVISHIGKNTECGHYVCHIDIPNVGWVLFNDDKVGKAEKPPLGHGFMYIYRRNDDNGTWN